MLQPKRTKFRKVHKGRNRGLAQGTDVSFGSFGLKAVGRGRLTARQIEAARRAMTRAVKRQGKIWIRVFPDKPINHFGFFEKMATAFFRISLSSVTMASSRFKRSFSSSSGVSL